MNEELPEVFDFSHGSTNPYTVETRHNLIPPCYHCNEFRPIILDGTEYYQYFMVGLRIQDAFPTLPAEQRELIMSGIHPQCWNEMMGEEK